MFQVTFNCAWHAKKAPFRMTRITSFVHLALILFQGSFNCATCFTLFCKLCPPTLDLDLLDLIKFFKLVISEVSPLLMYQPSFWNKIEIGSRRVFKESILQMVLQPINKVLFVEPIKIQVIHYRGNFIRQNLFSYTCLPIFKESHLQGTTDGESLAFKPFK